SGGDLSKAEWLSSSPILYKDVLFVFCDVSSDHWLLALDRTSGKVLWERKRKQGEKDHNSSPLLVTAKDRTLLVVASSREVVALDPTQDKVVWTCKCGAGRYPCLAYGNGLLFVTAAAA